MKVLLSGFNGCLNNIEKNNSSLKEASYYYVKAKRENRLLSLTSNSVYFKDNSTIVIFYSSHIHLIKVYNYLTAPALFGYYSGNRICNKLFCHLLPVYLKSIAIYSDAKRTLAVKEKEIKINKGTL